MEEVKRYSLPKDDERTILREGESHSKALYSNIQGFSMRKIGCFCCTRVAFAP